MKNILTILSALLIINLLFAPIRNFCESQDSQDAIFSTPPYAKEESQADSPDGGRLGLDETQKYLFYIIEQIITLENVEEIKDLFKANFELKELPLGWKYYELKNYSIFKSVTIYFGQQSYGMVDRVTLKLVTTRKFSFDKALVYFSKYERMPDIYRNENLSTRREGFKASDNITLVFQVNSDKKIDEVFIAKIQAKKQ